MLGDRLRRWVSHRLADQANATAGQGIRNATDFVVYALLGGLIGGLVALVEWVAIEWLLHDAEAGPRWLIALLPGVGLAVTAVLVRLGGTDVSTSDDYVKAFHGKSTLPPGDLRTKIPAAIATLGSGGALGLEGPAVHLGATVGRWTGGRLPRYDGPRHRALLVAGAAAGVASVFKAPATGVLFALESPYRRDLARHALLPSLIASAAAYLVFVPLINDDALLPLRFIGETTTSQIVGALAVGLLGGILARGTVYLFARSKRIAKTVSPWIRVPVAGTVLGAAALASFEMVGDSITFGPGAEKVVDLIYQDHGFWVILALLGLRLVATSTSLAGGGVGGLFIPLVVIGLMLGRLIELGAGNVPGGLFPAIGLAAVLGAGYRTPLAAVMFVAETTGRAEFVIPALLATAVSQAVMGDTSVAPDQLDERKGRLEQRLSRPAIDVTVRNVAVLSPDERLADIVDHLDVDRHLPALPVVHDKGCDLLILNEIAMAIFDKGEAALVRHASRPIPTVGQRAPATEAARIMTDNNCAAVAVVDQAGHPIGLITTESLADLAGIDLDA